MWSVDPCVVLHVILCRVSMLCVTNFHCVNVTEPADWILWRETCKQLNQCLRLHILNSSGTLTAIKHSVIISCCLGKLDTNQATKWLTFLGKRQVHIKQRKSCFELYNPDSVDPWFKMTHIKNLCNIFLIVCWTLSLLALTSNAWRHQSFFIEFFLAGIAVCFLWINLVNFLEDWWNRPLDIAAWFMTWYVFFLAVLYYL